MYGRGQSHKPVLYKCTQCVQLRKGDLRLWAAANTQRHTKCTVHRTWLRLRPYTTHSNLPERPWPETLNKICIRRNTLCTCVAIWQIGNPTGLLIAWNPLRKQNPVNFRWCRVNKMQWCHRKLLIVLILVQFGKHFKFWLKNLHFEFSFLNVWDNFSSVYLLGAIILSMLWFVRSHHFNLLRYDFQRPFSLFFYAFLEDFLFRFKN